MSTESASAKQETVSRVVLPTGEPHVLSEVQGGTMHVRFRDRELVIGADQAGEVLFPTDVGLSLLAALNEEPTIGLRGRRVLDVGCGCGLYSLAALAEEATWVTALDINPACVEATQGNAKVNGFAPDVLEPLVSDLASVRVTRPWDVVLANPPHFPDDPTYLVAGGQRTALVGGLDGRALYDALLSRLDELLVGGGVVVLAHSSLTGIEHTKAELAARGYRCRTGMVVELDLPLRGYAPYRPQLLARLYALRRAGCAQFNGLRFEVHVLIATRPVKE